LTPEQRARVEAWLRNPAPGSCAEAAQKYGIDVTVNIAQLRLTPDQRARKLEDASSALEPLIGIARKHR
jgi:hypothetical protein